MSDYNKTLPGDESPNEDVSLTPDRAFVLQFRAGATGEPGRCTGRM